jgi:hypothetical protein
MPGVSWFIDLDPNAGAVGICRNSSIMRIGPCAASK